MIRIQQLKFRVNYNEQNIIDQIRKELKITDKQEFTYTIIKKSIDARNKSNIKVVITFDVKIGNEKNVLKRVDSNKIMSTKDNKYEFIEKPKKLDHQPIIVGAGPAGLFCALLLAEHGYQPILLERGKDVDKRILDVHSFWMGKHLNTESNVQFGEGGAGTFSDGKLNTMVKDIFFRNRKILETFVEAGAPSDIMFLNKPHIGTDNLRKVVKNIRNRIIELGGEVRFENKVTSFVIDNNAITGVIINNKTLLSATTVVIALGHSARDTFKVLSELEISMEKKAFAIGLRIEHPQEQINRSQYGENLNQQGLPVPDYKLTYRSSNGRGVYSFCMCPGGVVVNASSEKNHLVTNGMSNYMRNEVNANSAILVNVMPDDFGGNDVLAGVAFQRKWESKAFLLGGSDYYMPIQLYGDFAKNMQSKSIGDVNPSIERAKLTDLNKCLPKYVSDSIKEGVLAFGRRIKGFDRYDAILSGVETRSSSPIRILRDENYESNIKGLYPCGEGAGYAGGIMSAAIDGIKVAEAIAKY